MRAHWRKMIYPAESCLVGPTIEEGSSVSPPELAEIMRLSKGKQVLEIGTAFGYTTIAMASVASSVTTLDIVDRREILARYFEGYRVKSKVSILLGDSLAVLPSLSLSFDFVFVDGYHYYPQLSSDILQAIRLVNPNCPIGIHDYNEEGNPEVAFACNWIFPNQTFENTRIIDTLLVIFNIPDAMRR